MTDDDIKIAIAEVCGWTCIEHRPSQFGPAWLSGMNPNPPTIVQVIDCETWKSRAPNESDYGWESLPDYCHDLNAMYEAESALTPEQVAQYFHELAVLVGRMMMSLRHQQYWPVVHASARQRAEAFVKTLNLWIP